MPPRPTPDQAYDAVVVGAGISGAAAAYELAAAGCSVVLLDRFGPAAMASGWTLAGVRQSGRHAAELPLAKAAVQRWGTLADELDAPTGYRRTGNLRCARTPAEVAIIRNLVTAQAAAGLELSFLAGWPHTSRRNRPNYACTAARQAGLGSRQTREIMQQRTAIFGKIATLRGN